jgi:LysR family transcriptional regulator (chromosome initiation inhibitor)
LGIADFAIIPAERVPNEMDSKQLKPDRYLLVASAKWKNRKLVDIFASERIIDFSESDRTTTNYLRQFKLDGPVLRDRLFVNENAALIQYFIKGIGFGTLTEAAAKPYLANGDLITLNKGMAMLEPLALIWYPRTNRTEYFDDIVRSLK